MEKGTKKNPDELEGLNNMIKREVIKKIVARERTLKTA